MDSVSSTTGTELSRIQHILGLMQKNLECPICLDLLKNPVSTRCDHQFCRFCILKALRGRQSVSCPLCKVQVTKRSLQDNTQLQQIIQAVQSVTDAVYKDTGQQKAVPPGETAQNCRQSQDQEQREKRRHVSTDSDEGNSVPSAVQARNRRNIRQAKRRRVEGTPIYIEEGPVDDQSAPRPTTNINVSGGFPVQEQSSKGRKRRNLTSSPNETGRNSSSRRTRHAARRDGRATTDQQGSVRQEQTATNAELLSALVENSLGVTGNDRVTKSDHGDDDITANADPSGDRLLHVLGEASLGMFGENIAENIQASVAVNNSGGNGQTVEECKGDTAAERALLSSQDHDAGLGTGEGPPGEEQRSDTLGPTISEAEPLDISKDEQPTAASLLTTEDEVPADIGKEVQAKEKVEFWLKHHSLQAEANQPDTETDDVDPYEFIGSQQDPSKEKKSKMRGKKGGKPVTTDSKNRNTPKGVQKSSTRPSKGTPAKMSAKKVQEAEDMEVNLETGAADEGMDDEEDSTSAASVTDGSEASWKPGQSDPDWGKGRSSRRKSAHGEADRNSVSSKGRKRKRPRREDREDQMTVSSGSSSQLRIDRWVQRKEKVFVKSYSKPALSRREKTLLQKKTAGLEEQWKRAKDMAGDFSAKVLHPIAEVASSKTKRKSKNSDVVSKVSTDKICSGTDGHPLQPSPARPKVGKREEVQNSDDDMCVYLTSNGELLSGSNSSERSDDPTEDVHVGEQGKQSTKEKSVALTDQEQKIAADIMELDEQTLSQLGMFSQQYLQKRKRRKERKQRRKDGQSEDAEDNILAVIQALEGESNLDKEKHLLQDKTPGKVDAESEVGKDMFATEDCTDQLPGGRNGSAMRQKATSSSFGKETSSNHLQDEGQVLILESGTHTTEIAEKEHKSLSPSCETGRKSRLESHTRMSTQTRSSSRDRKGQGEATEEEMKPRRTRSSARKGTEADNIETSPPMKGNSNVFTGDGSTGHKESPRRARSTSRGRKKMQDNKKVVGRDAEESAVPPGIMAEKVRHIPEDKRICGDDKVMNRQSEDKRKKEAATEGKLSSLKVAETKQEGSTNLGDVVSEQNVATLEKREALQKRNHHTTEEKAMSDIKVMTNTESLGTRQMRCDKKPAESGNDHDTLDPKHVPVGTSNDKVPDDPYQFQCSQEFNGKGAGKKRGRRQRGKAKKLKRMKARKRELQLITTGWMDRNEHSEKEDESEEEIVEENINENKQTNEETVSMNMPEPGNVLPLSPRKDYEEEGNPNTASNGEEINNTEVSVVPESHPNTEPGTGLMKKGKGNNSIVDEQRAKQFPEGSKSADRHLSPSERRARRDSCSGDEAGRHPDISSSPVEPVQVQSFPVEETQGVYSTDVIPPSAEERDLPHHATSHAGENRRKKTSQKRIGEGEKLATAREPTLRETEDSEDVVEPSWQEKEQRQIKNKVYKKDGNVTLSGVQEQDLRRSPRQTPNKTLAEDKGGEGNISSHRHSLRKTFNKSKDEKDVIRRSPRQSQKKPLDRNEDRERDTKSPNHMAWKDKNSQLDIRSNLRHRGERPCEGSPKKHLDEDKYGEEDLKSSPRHRTKKPLAEDQHGEEDIRSSPRNSPSKGFKRDKDEEEILRRSPRHKTEDVMDNHKNKPGKRNSHTSDKENRLKRQDFGNVVRNIPDTIELASPPPPARRSWAGVAANTRSHKMGEGLVLNSGNDEEFLSSPPSQNRNVEDSMEDCGMLQEREMTEFEGKRVEVVADVHRLAEFSEGSPRSQRPNVARKASPEVQSPGCHASGRTAASLCSSGKDSTPGEVPPTPAPSNPPVLPARLSTSLQKEPKDKNKLSTRRLRQRRSSHLSSPETTPSTPFTHVSSPENTPPTSSHKSQAASLKSLVKSCTAPTAIPDSANVASNSCSQESKASTVTVCSQVSTQSGDRQRRGTSLESDVLPDSEDCVTKKGKMRCTSFQKTSNDVGTCSPKRKVTSPSVPFQQSFPTSSENTEASISLLENVTVQPGGAEKCSQQKRKSPRLNRGLSNGGEDGKTSEGLTVTEPHQVEQSEDEQKSQGSHPKEAASGDMKNRDAEKDIGGHQQDKNYSSKLSNRKVEEQATFDGYDKRCKGSTHKQDSRVEGGKEEDAVSEEEEEEEDDLIPPTPPDTSLTQLTQTRHVKSSAGRHDGVGRDNLEEDGEDEDRECSWSDDDDDELPDLEGHAHNPPTPNAPTHQSSTTTPQHGRAEKQSAMMEEDGEATKETEADVSPRVSDTEKKPHPKDKRSSKAEGKHELQDEESTDEVLPQRKESGGNSRPALEEEKIHEADIGIEDAAGFNEESDLSQDSHTHDLTSASSFLGSQSELYDTQHQDKLKNDVQNLEGQMAVIQMLLAKGKERAKETGKEEKVEDEPSNTIAEQHLTTVQDEDTHISEGEEEENLSGKDLYGTPSSQASAKPSTAQEEMRIKLRSSRTPSQTSNSPDKEYNFRKRVSSPHASEKSGTSGLRKSRQAQSSSQLSQPCLSPRSPSPPPPLSPEKLQTQRALPPAVRAAANILEKFKSPDVTAEDSRRNSSSCSPVEKEDATARRTSQRRKERSRSPLERKNATLRNSSGYKESDTKNNVSPRRKDCDSQETKEPVGDAGELTDEVKKDSRSVNKRKSNSYRKDADKEDHPYTRRDAVHSVADDKIELCEEDRGDVSEPEEDDSKWKAFQQMKCDILAQKPTPRNKGQTKDTSSIRKKASGRLSLPSTQRSDKLFSDKRRSEPAIPSSQLDKNSVPSNPSTPQLGKIPLTFSQQPSPSLRDLPQGSSRSKKNSLHLGNKSPTDRQPKETAQVTSRSLGSCVKSCGGAAGETAAVKSEWQDSHRGPMTFVTTGLSKEETRAVHELAKKTGSQVKQTFDNSTTHVITRTDVDMFCSRTLKFFLGIAGRKWIVSYEWIAACLKEGRQLPEDPYEVRGDLVHGCHGGPRQARTNKGKLLLSDYEICIYGKFTALTRDDLQFMVELCGGTVVKEPHMFPHDKKPLIVSQVDANQLTEDDYNAFYRRYGVLSVTRDWILDSVSSYRVQPIDGYLMCSTGNQNVIVID